MKKELGLLLAILAVMFVLAGCNEEQQNPPNRIQRDSPDGNFLDNPRGMPEDGNFGEMRGMPPEMLEELGLSENASQAEIQNAMRIKLGLPEGTSNEEIRSAWADYMMSINNDFTIGWRS